MKINYNGFRPMPISASETMVSCAYEYKNYYYMRIELACAHIVCSPEKGFIPFVNLHSGTVRMLQRREEVHPLQSKVQLRQGHTHEELSE